MRPQYGCFYLHQNLHLGWIRGQDGGYLRVLLSDGRELRQRPGNLLYRWHGDEATQDEAAVEQLRNRERALPDVSAALDALFGTLEAGRRYGVEALIARVVPPQAGGWEKAAVFLALLRDNLRYRYGGGSFIPRSEAEISERVKHETEREARLEWVEKARQWRDLLKAGHWKVGDDPEAAEFLSQIQDLLARDKRSPHWGVLARALELFHLHPVDLEMRLKHWLETADAWPGWPAIWLRWGEVDRSFADGLEALASAMAAAPVETEGRVDYRGRETYTIDSPDTKDIDDAISILDVDPQGLTLALHIAEPSRVLERGHPLFEEAARRLSSVYTLAGIFPMFPAALSNDRFSLIQGRDREAVTFRLRVEAGEGRLLGVERSLVRVARNLDYDQALALLTELPDTWGRLAGLCASLTEERVRKGAIVQERRELSLDISDPDHVGMTEVNRSGPVQQMVEELAIVHNREAGSYCRRHRLPAIYRVQPRYRRSPAIWHEVSEPLPAARFSTQGEEHAGLACVRYVQTTSPIRRFADLVMQRQIIEHAVHGRIAFPQETQLGEWADRAEGRMSVYNDVARQIEDYWKRRYLAQHKGLVLEGVARRRAAGPDRVWLETLALTAEGSLPPGTRDGERVRVRVESVQEDCRSVWVACVN